MSSHRLSKLCLSLLMGLSLGLTACGQASPTGAMRTSVQGKMRLLSSTLPAQSSFEQAFPVARALAQKLATGPISVASISGTGVGPDGRLMTTEQLAAQVGSEFAYPSWRFSFVGPNPEGRRTLDITVDTDGKAYDANSQIMTDLSTWQLDPQSVVSIKQAVQQAIADGLSAQGFTVRLAPVDAMFGATKTHVGPLVYFVTDVALERAQDYRMVFARNGALPKKASPYEVEQVRQVVSLIIQRWHQSIAGGADRSVRLADLLRVGYTQEAAENFLDRFDRNGDRQVTFAEMRDAFTTEPALKMWREGVIKFQFWRADADDDERLTLAEAYRLDMELLGANNRIETWPLRVYSQDFSAADRDGNGTLDVEEYVPLGIKKTLEALDGNPKLLDRVLQVWIKAIPWSH